MFYFIVTNELFDLTWSFLQQNSSLTATSLNGWQCWLLAGWLLTRDTRGWRQMSDHWPLRSPGPPLMVATSPGCHLATSVSPD